MQARNQSKTLQSNTYFSNGGNSVSEYQLPAINPKILQQSSSPIGSKNVKD
jgi:hypothetical protein